MKTKIGEHRKNIQGVFSKKSSLSNLFSKIFTLYLAIALLFLVPVYGAESSIVSTEVIQNSESNNGSFGKITPIENSEIKTKEEKVSLLVASNTQIPVQGRVSPSSGLPYNGNVYVCINDNNCTLITASNGIFNAKVLTTLEDPHSQQNLKVYVGSNTSGPLVINENFYPAGGPQGDLTVNGVLTVTQNGFINGSQICTAANGLCGTGSGDITDVNAGTGITVLNPTGPAPTVSLNTTFTDSRYLQSYTETDPIWTLEKNNYYNKTESDARYLQNYTETDPIWNSEQINAPSTVQ